MKTTTTLSMLLIALLAAGGLGCDQTAPETVAPVEPAEPAEPAEPRIPEPPALEPQAADPKTAEAATALADALDDPDPYARARKLGTLLPTLGPEALPEVKRILDKFRLDRGAVEYELLLRFWAEQEPIETTYWALGYLNVPPLFKLAAGRLVVEVAAEADPEATASVVDGVLEGTTEDMARVLPLALVRGWFRADRDGLEKYTQGLGAGLKRQRALFALALALTEADGSAAAIAWAEAVPEDDPRYKLAVYRQVLSALTWHDMPAATRFCDAHCDGPYGSRLRTVLIRTRLNNGEDGGPVLEWAAQAPAETEEQLKQKKHAIWIAYVTWALEDRAAAVRWMDGKLAEAGDGEPEPWIRGLYGEYGRQLAADDPERALEWAARAENEVLREINMARIARFWYRSDPESAEAWLLQSPLSEKARGDARDVGLPDYIPTNP